jgi:predicted RNase H-like nuclease
VEGVVSQQPAPDAAAKAQRQRIVTAGVDGCRDGWVAAVCVGDGLVRLCGFNTVTELMSGLGSAARVAIDVPIGLLDEGRRECDVMARAMLGERRNSVFTAPIRPVLGATSYRSACDLRHEVEGKRMSRQAWGIVRKVAEVDLALEKTPAWRGRLREVHPEVCFTVLNQGVPLPLAKKGRAGREIRVGLLRRAFPRDDIDALVAAPRPLGCAADDAIDALVSLWTARRMRDGVARVLPASPPVDTKGLSMEIVA